MVRKELNSARHQVHFEVIIESHQVYLEEILESLKSTFKRKRSKLTRF